MCCTPENDSRRIRRESGFTLIEMLVVLAIIATLAALVGPQVFRNVSDAKMTAAKTQMEMIALALDAYRLDNAIYPSTDQGLVALTEKPTLGDPPINWRGPYLRRVVPLDPWGRPYLYRIVGDAGASVFEVKSLGRDGRDGGAAEDADIAVTSDIVRR